METLDALRSYVRFLREREGVRDVHLSRDARRGLALLAASGRPASTQSATGNRRSPGDGLLPPNGRQIETAFSSKVSGVGPTPGEATSSSQPPRTAPAKTASPPNNKFPSVPLPEETLPVSGSSKAEQLRHLGERAAVCVKCPHLAARRHSVVFGVGDPEARILFVGEAPGEDEDLQGEPFVGRAGQLLTKMIGAMGLTRGQVYIANILKCRPDMPAGSPGNRKPTKDEMDTCLPYLRAQIDVIKPEVMIALGATALDGLLGPIGGISKLRGKFLEYRGIPLMPTFHPSYLLRNASNTEKRKVWEDLMQVMERTGMPISEKQRGYFLSK
jgi:uracil-DNA glycosylase family 4